MESSGAVVIVTDVVFTRPENLHGYAGQSRLRSCLSNKPGDLSHLSVVLVIQPASETAACTHQMHRDVAVLYSSGRGCRGQGLSWRLTGRPEFEFAVRLEMCSGVHRLERSMGQHWKVILRLHNFCGAFESRIDIAHVRYARAARSAAPGSAGSGRWGRRRDRLSEQLFGLRCISHTALRGNRPFIPNNFE